MSRRILRLCKHQFGYDCRHPDGKIFIHHRQRMAGVGGASRKKMGCLGTSVDELPALDDLITGLSYQSNQTLRDRHARVGWCSFGVGTVMS